MLKIRYQNRGWNAFPPKKYKGVKQLLSAPLIMLKYQLKGSTVFTGLNTKQIENWKFSFFSFVLFHYKNKVNPMSSLVFDDISVVPFPQHLLDPGGKKLTN